MKNNVYILEDRAILYINGVDAKIKEFRNHLSFDTIDPFMEYTIASLEKNRKVYDEFLKNKDLKKLLEKVKKILEKKILSQGKLEITKVVGGISASNIWY